MRWWRWAPEKRATEKRAPEARPDPDEAVARFWRRWHEELPRIAARLGDNDPRQADELLGALVAELDPRLRGSVERGAVASYALVVSGAEDPELRPLTDAWLRAAPVPDLVWEYHDSVPPVPDPTEVTVRLGARPVPLAEVRVTARVDDAAGLVDLVVHHPVFAELDAGTTEAVMFLAVEATLGERVAGGRLRRVVSSPTEPADAVDLMALRSLVHRLGGP